MVYILKAVVYIRCIKSILLTTIRMIKSHNGDGMEKHELPELGYSYDALEPYIDRETMKIHHSKHHQAYVDKLNAALEGHNVKERSAQYLLKNLGGLPEKIREAVRNNGGGHVNHSFFWTVLRKDTKPEGRVLEEIKGSFGSFEAFKEEFSRKAAGHFGSGWAWLVPDGGKLSIMTTVNQDSPLSLGKVPLLTLDLWEHAYYLKYQNRRPEYIEAFFKVIDWDRVGEYLEASRKRGT
jgi:superoxide dismutase, Fe-Mn family